MQFRYLTVKVSETRDPGLSPTPFVSIAVKSPSFTLRIYKYRADSSKDSILDLNAEAPSFNLVESPTTMTKIFVVFLVSSGEFDIVTSASCLFFILI